MIGRIEYTSCEDGVDGIRGFQVRAITPGIADNLRTAALRDSVYEPPPATPPMPTSEQLSAFPVAFGYSSAPDGVAIYQATYVGRDHTGRWGNYFAQAITIGAGDPRPELPIDLWRAPIWRQASDRAGQLDAVEPAELQPGRPADVATTATFLSSSDRQRTLPLLLATVRGLLDSRRGRLVLTVDDSTTAALWVSAVTRSLPQSLAWAVTFTTFASRPESHSALLAFATPDVSVPTYGNYQLINLRSATLDAELSDYDQVMAQLWLDDGPTGLLHRATAIRPSLASSELDLFVRSALLFEALPAAIDWTEAKVLTGLRFAVDRMPGSVTQPWDKVAVAVREMGELRDISGWSEVLRGAAGQGAPVPGPLLQTYVKSAVQAVIEGRADPTVWMPSLEPGSRRELAKSYLAPSLWNQPSPTLLTWLQRPANNELREAALDELAAKVEPPLALHAAIGSLTVSTAQAISPLAAARPRLQLVVEIVLAGAGLLDPVGVLLALPSEALRPSDDRASLPSLLWPAQPPTAEQCRSLLAQLSTEQLRDLGLVDQSVQRLLVDCERGLGIPDFDLARDIGALVATAPDLISRSNAPVVNLVSIIGYLETDPTYDEAGEHVARGVRMRAGVWSALADQFNLAAAGWVFRLDVGPHRKALHDLVAPDVSGLSVRYAEAAEVGLPIATPERVAELLTTWRRLAVPSNPPDRAKDVAALKFSGILLEEVLPRGLERVNAKYIERLGETDLVKRRASFDGDEFGAWWKAWQQRHPRQGLFSRFKLPRFGEAR